MSSEDSCIPMYIPIRIYRRRVPLHLGKLLQPRKLWPVVLFVLSTMLDPHKGQAPDPEEELSDTLLRLFDALAGLHDRQILPILDLSVLSMNSL